MREQGDSQPSRKGVRNPLAPRHRANRYSIISIGLRILLTISLVNRQVSQVDNWSADNVPSIRSSVHAPGHTLV